MKIKVTLRNSAGELDNETIEVRDDDDCAEVGGAIDEALSELTARCVFAIGDTITIEEVR